MGRPNAKISGLFEAEYRKYPLRISLLLNEPIALILYPERFYE